MQRDHDKVINQLGHKPYPMKCFDSIEYKGWVMAHPFILTTWI
jgi:hypothetical protein